MQDPLAVWKSQVPEATQVGLHLAVLEATRRAFAVSKAAFLGYGPLNYIIGWNRFTALQCDLLAFGKTDQVLNSRELFHSNGLPFTQLYTPRLHITTANVESENAHPQMSFFREQEQTKQLAFLNGAELLICHLTVQVANDLSAPSSVRIHFPDGHEGYLEPFVDIAAARPEPAILPYEKVKDLRYTPPVGSEQSRVDNDFA